MPGVFQIKGRRCGTVQNSILVGSTAAIPSRVKGVVDDFDGLDRNVLRRESVKAPPESVQIDLFFGKEISYLAQRVNPGIRTPGTVNAGGRSLLYVLMRTALLLEPLESFARSVGLASRGSLSRRTRW